MLENIISIGTAAVGVGGSVASMYSAVSAIGTGHFQNKLLSLLTPRSVIRLNEHILYAPDSAPVVAPGAAPIDPRAILQSLEQVQRALKQNIITSGTLPTPEELQRQFKLDPKHCLIGIEPLHQLRSGRSSDWAPVLFLKDGTPYVGWQKKGMLRAALGFDFSDDLEAWIRRPQTVPDASPSPPAQKARTSAASKPKGRSGTRAKASKSTRERR